ncbi:Fucose permease [Parelusimicrobium proximum]|uniref:MFS transporter n=1 Tax=Parelusimicrobium proximum TaxID=3228953 RepID=UPI003D1761C6
MNKKVLAVLMVFFAMGFGDVVGPITSLAKDTFNLSYRTAGLLPMVGFIMFFLLSVPFGLLQDKKGKKFVLNIGLITAGVGLILPICLGMYGKFTATANSMTAFYVILTAIMLLCGGATILQVSGNAVMKDVSSDADYAGNMSLAQGIKAVGSSVGFILPPLAAKLFGLDWTVLFPFYCIMVIITLLWLNAAGIDEKKTEGNSATFASCFKLFFGNSYVLMMVMTIFMYVGAEVCVNANTPMLLKDVFGLGASTLIVAWSLFFLPILVGRLAGPVILKKISPKTFLMYTTILAIVGVVLIFTKVFALCCIGTLLIGFGFANIFPLVFSITVEHMPERNNELSALMVMAISGGALFPFIMGTVADSAGLIAGYAVPLVCLFYILFVAWFNMKPQAAK